MKIAITGTTKGIGKAIKKQLLLKDYKVKDINRSDYDLSNFNNIIDIDLTGCDVLINNAGHDIGMGNNYKTMKKEDIINQVNVNLLSPMLLTHSFVQQNKSGTVINITSGSINDLKENMVTYYTTKSALSCFTKAINIDLKDKFRFVEVIPRRVKTNFFETSNATHLKTSQYLIKAKEVAKVILYIIDNPLITNITIKDHRR